MRGPATAALQRAQAGVARRAPRVEVRDLDQPTAAEATPIGVARLFALRPQPAQVRAVHHRHRLGASLHEGAKPGAQKALCGEHRHLRVVSDRAEPAERRRVIGDAVTAEPAANLGEAHELDGCAERVAHRAAEQAAEEVTFVEPCSHHCALLHCRNAVRNAGAAAPPTPACDS